MRRSRLWQMPVAAATAVAETDPRTLWNSCSAPFPRLNTFLPRGALYAMSHVARHRFRRGPTRVQRVMLRGLPPRWPQQQAGETDPGDIASGTSRRRVSKNGIVVASTISSFAAAWLCSSPKSTRGCSDLGFRRWTSESAQTRRHHFALQRWPWTPPSLSSQLKPILPPESDALVQTSAAQDG